MRSVIVHFLESIACTGLLSLFSLMCVFLVASLFPPFLVRLLLISEFGADLVSLNMLNVSSISFIARPQFIFLKLWWVFMDLMFIDFMPFARLKLYNWLKISDPLLVDGAKNKIEITFRSLNMFHSVWLLSLFCFLLKTWVENMNDFEELKRWKKGNKKEKKRKKFFDKVLKFASFNVNHWTMSKQSYEQVKDDNIYVSGKEYLPFSSIFEIRMVPFGKIDINLHEQKAKLNVSKQTTKVKDQKQMKTKIGKRQSQRKAKAKKAQAVISK